MTVMFVFVFVCVFGILQLKWFKYLFHEVSNFI